MVSSLMLNYLSLWFCTYILMHFILDSSVGSASHRLPSESKLATLISGTRIHTGVFIAPGSGDTGIYFPV